MKIEQWLGSVSDHPLSEQFVNQTKTILDAIADAFLHASLFIHILFLFRPHQLMGVKGRLIWLFASHISWT